MKTCRHQSPFLIALGISLALTPACGQGSKQGPVKFDEFASLAQ